MDTLDDLLSKRRRGALSEADARRLRSGLRASPEHELSLLAGDVFERDGAALPGDAELVQRIVAGATQRAHGNARGNAHDNVRHIRWPRPVRMLVVAPLFVAAAAAASVGGYQALEALRAASASTQPPVASPRPAHRALASTPAAPEVASAVAPALAAPEPAEPLPALVPPPVAALAPERPRPAPPQAALPRGRAPRRAPVSEAPVVRAPHVAFEAPPASVSADDGPAALFQRANALRRADWSAAAAGYVELIRRHPRSSEAGVAEVALGKWSLSLGRSGDALDWFRAHERRGDGPLAAEALWGEAQALESIGSHAAARLPWQRLLERYPSSPYARVARERLSRTE